MSFQTGQYLALGDSYGEEMGNFFTSSAQGPAQWSSGLESPAVTTHHKSMHSPKEMHVCSAHMLGVRASPLTYSERVILAVAVSAERRENFSLVTWDEWWGSGCHCWGWAGHALQALSLLGYSDSLRSSSEKESLHSTQDLEGKPKRKGFKTKDSALDLLSGSAATDCRIHCRKDRLAQVITSRLTLVELS